MCNSPDPRAVPCLPRGAWIRARCRAELGHCWGSAQTSRRGRKAGAACRPRVPRCPFAGEGAAGARGRGALSLPKIAGSARGTGLLCGRCLPAFAAGWELTDGHPIKTPHPRVISSSRALFIYLFLIPFQFPQMRFDEYSSLSALIPG